MSDPRTAVAAALTEFAAAAFGELIQRVQAHNADAPPEAVLDPSQLLVARGELRRLAADVKGGKGLPEIKARLQRLLAEAEERRAERSNA